MSKNVVICFFGFQCGGRNEEVSSLVKGVAHGLHRELVKWGHKFDFSPSVWWQPFWMLWMLSPTLAVNTTHIPHINREATCSTTIPNELNPLFRNKVFLLLYHHTGCYRVTRLFSMPWDCWQCWNRSILLTRTANFFEGKQLDVEVGSRLRNL